MNFERQQLGLVRKLAVSVKSKVPANVELDDLIQAGSIGLLDALKCYQPDHGTSFEAYAAPRIRGAMFDELRAQDPFSRTERGKQKSITATVDALASVLCRKPLDSEVADVLGMDLRTYQQTAAQVNNRQTLSAEDLNTQEEDFVDTIVAEDACEPSTVLEDEQTLITIMQSIKTLAERQQLIMRLRYDDDQSLEQIAQQLKVSSSRVSQLHAESIVHIRKQLSRQSLLQ